MEKQNERDLKIHHKLKIDKNTNTHLNSTQMHYFQAFSSPIQPISFSGEQFIK